MVRITALGLLLAASPALAQGLTAEQLQSRHDRLGIAFGMSQAEVEGREGRPPDGAWDSLLTYADDIGPFFEVTYTFDGDALRRVGYFGAFDGDDVGHEAYVWVREAVRVVWGAPVVEDEAYDVGEEDADGWVGVRSAWDGGTTVVVLTLEEAAPASVMHYLALLYLDAAFSDYHLPRYNHDNPDAR